MKLKLLKLDGDGSKLDVDGSKKAAEAFKSYNSTTERAKEPSSQPSPVTATVQGTMKGNQIEVDSIDIRRSICRWRSAGACALRAEARQRVLLARRPGEELMRVQSISASPSAISADRGVTVGATL